MEEENNIPVHFIKNSLSREIIMEGTVKEKSHFRQYTYDIYEDFICAQVNHVF